MDYKISRYTYFFRSDRGDSFVYNSQTNSLIKLGEKIYITIEKAKVIGDTTFRQLPRGIFEEFRKAKIITTLEEEENYLLSLEINNDISRFMANRLVLVIAPTTMCNFDCPYCFEKNKTSKIMSDKTIDDTIRFIKDFKYSDRLHLTWYGGEPLLALDVIKKILYKIREELPLLKIDYHFLVTNGYNLNEQTIDLFQEYPLNEIQITLDGDKERHNQKRRLKNSNIGSYDRILANIDLVASSLPDTTVSIRVNIDKDNAHEFAAIRASLLQKWNHHKNIMIYPGIIRIEDEEHKCMGCESLLHRDIRDLFFSLDNDVYFYPRLSSKGCCATRVNSYVIGPEGEFYKCWNDMSDPNKIVGYIDREHLTNKDLFNRYIASTSCFKDNKCRDCFYLPICVGGCAYYKLKNIFDGGHYDLCSLYKDEGVLKKCLELHYYKKKKNE